MIITGSLSMDAQHSVQRFIVGWRVQLEAMSIIWWDRVSSRRSLSPITPQPTKSIYLSSRGIRSYQWVARHTSVVRRRVLVAETTTHISYKLLDHHYPLNIIYLRLSIYTV